MSEFKLKKKFVKDEKLPIPVFDEPYFSYFLNLYEKEFGANTKYEKFIENVNSVGGWDNYFSAYIKFKDDIIYDVLKKESYKDYLEFDLTDYNFTRTYNSNNRSFFVEHNKEKTWISIDIKSANFYSMKYINPDLVNNKDSYLDWVSEYENSNLFAEIKSIRQLIFGNLNPKRQQKIQAFILDLLMKKISQKISDEEIEFCIMGSDEVMIEYTDKRDSMLVNILLEFEKETGFRLDKKIFKFIKNGNESEFGFVKIYDDNKIDFIGVNKHFFAQAYKNYLGEIILPYDLLFYNENKLSTFLEALKNK